jgi:DNA-binding NtrC family response regulator
MGRKGLQLGEESRRALQEHSWPGNVRELQNSLERAVILCDSDTIRPEDLRLDDGEGRGPSLADIVDLSGSLAEVSRRTVALAEEETIRLALAETGGDRTVAAKRLGISASTLSRRIKALGL